MNIKNDLLAVCRDAADRLEHERNMRGKTTRRCETCKGTGQESPGYADHDGSGSFWVSPTPCPECRGSRYFEVPCLPKMHAAALRKSINALRRRLRQVERKMVAP